MTPISAAHDRLQRAGDLAAVLDAAYAAFERMVAVLHALQDSDSGLFAAAVMAAASAAGGRDALLFAQSLPEHPLPAPIPAKQPDASHNPQGMAAGVDRHEKSSGLMMCGCEG